MKNSLGVGLKAASALLIGAAAFLSWTSASAALLLKLESGATSITVEDGGAGDVSGAPGVKDNVIVYVQPIGPFNAVDYRVLETELNMRNYSESEKILLYRRIKAGIAVILEHRDKNEER